MDRLIKLITFWCGIVCIVVIIMQCLWPSAILLSLVITLGVVVYQLGMRLLTGNVVERFFPQRFSYDHGWFSVRPGEIKLYHCLKVKQWKKHLPTYDPDKYDVRKHSVEEIIQTMCCAELDHELMMVFGYLPIILIWWFGDPAVFIITSIVASLIELPFIVMQRFNRNRLVKIAKRKEKRSSLRVD